MCVPGWGTVLRFPAVIRPDDVRRGGYALRGGLPITDQASADEFLSITMSDLMELYERVEQEDGTIVYRSSPGATAFVVTDDALLAGMVEHRGFARRGCR